MSSPLETISHKTNPVNRLNNPCKLSIIKLIGLASGLSLSFALPVVMADIPQQSQQQPQHAASEQTRSSSVPEGNYPKRGMSMGQVREQHGAPTSQREPKVKTQRDQPNIVIWQYAAFAVYFQQRDQQHRVLYTLVYE